MLLKPILKQTYYIYTCTYIYIYIYVYIYIYISIYLSVYCEYKRTMHDVHREYCFLTLPTLHPKPEDP